MSPGLVLDVSSQTDFKALPAAAYFSRATEYSLIEPACSTMLDTTSVTTNTRRQTCRGRRQTRNTTGANAVPPMVEIPELVDSDSENIFVQHLATSMAQIQSKNDQQHGLLAESLPQSESLPVKARSTRARRTAKRRNRLTQPDAVPEAATEQPQATSRDEDEVEAAATITTKYPMAVRRLAPLLETSQFLQTDNSFTMAEEVSRGLAELEVDAKRETRKKTLAVTGSLPANSSVGGVPTGGGRVLRSRRAAKQLSAPK